MRIERGGVSCSAAMHGAACPVSSSARIAELLGTGASDPHVRRHRFSATVRRAVKLSLQPRASAAIADARRRCAGFKRHRYFSHAQTPAVGSRSHPG
ncbi:hypothetical protein AQ611_04865 [Burkholderia singularis]|nr:hypothetical protein AQ611_04865 [Burkholderia sp. Bp7605]